MTCKFHTFKTNRYMDIIKPILKQDNTLQQEQRQQQQKIIKKIVTHYSLISTQSPILPEILPMHSYVHKTALIS